MSDAHRAYVGETSTFATGDGTIEGRWVYGDGSTGPFLHIRTTNADGDEAEIALDRDNVVVYARWLLKQVDDEHRDNVTPIDR